MIRIDGSMGEGGGQVLRTALSLSMITGEALIMHNIRAGRKKPGLMRQHLTAVKAAQEVCSARVDGAEAGSTELEFKPGTIRPGQYAFAIGTAGSATLVMQTVLPALLMAGGQSSLALEGGTHNPLAPPFDFLERTFLPLLRRMGFGVNAHLARYGFYPAGGGKILVNIDQSNPAPLQLVHRPGPTRITGRCLYANLPTSIAKREAAELMRRLDVLASEVEIVRVDSPGPGNAIVVECISQNGTDRLDEVFTSFGEKGVSSESVAAEAADQALAFASSTAAVGPYAADQILLPMVLAGGGEFTTVEPTLHTVTNIQVIETFLPGRFAITDAENGVSRIQCKQGVD